MTPLQQAEIYENWAKTIRMCAEHEVEPQYKFNGELLLYLSASNFISSYMLHQYEFPLAILEGKLVFEGDELYNHVGAKLKASHDKIEFGEPCIYWVSGGYNRISELSWNPPKPKTILVEMTVEDAEFMVRAYTGGTSSKLGRMADSCLKALKELK